MSYAFHKPNQASQHRANRISEDTWENYRRAIIKKFKSADRNGVAHAYKWVEDQDFLDFKPTLKQLRNRINVTWMNSDVERSDTSDILIKRTPDSLDTLDSLRTLDSTRTLDSPGTLESPNTSMSNTSVSTEEIESPRDSESSRTSESSGTSGEKAITNSPIAKLEGFPYVMSVIRIPTEQPTHGTRPKTFNISPLMGIPEKAMEISSPASHSAFNTTGFVSMKRRVGNLEVRDMREWKRQKEDDSSAAATLNGLQKLPVTDKEGSAASWNDPFSIPLTGSLSPVPLISSHTPSDQEFPGLIFNPERLQRLLAIIGVKWKFDTVARCLRKATVLRNSSANATDRLSLPASAYSVEHITKVQNLAEFLFASSLLEEAFPLFLHVWTVCRGDAYKGEKSLIQCVRSAASTGDQALMRAILEMEMLVLAQESPRHNLMQPLGYLELANVSQHQQNEDAFKLYRRRARSSCPEFVSLLNVFYEAGQKLGDIQEYWVIYGTDSFSDIITTQAFQHAECSQYYDMLAQKSDNNIGEHTIRDVLSAAIYLSHPTQSNAAAGVRHIRNCLQIVFKILSSPSWLSSYEIYWKRILQYLCGNPRSREFALFLSLWVNWKSRTGSYEDPEIEEITVEQENSFIGLSIVEILSVVTYFILSGETFHAFVRSKFCPNDLGNLKIPLLLEGDRVLGLLQLPDDDLMFGFLWCSVKLSRMNTAEGRCRIGSLAPLYKSMMIDIFDTGSCEEKNTTNQPNSTNIDRPCSAMTGITVNSTLAKSLSTTPTLASMRRKGRLSSSSTRSYLPSRTMTIDDLSELTSFISTSEIGNSHLVSADHVSVGYEKHLGLARQNKEISLRNRIGPSKPLPPLPVNPGEDPCLPKPTNPIIIVSGSDSYNKNPFTDAAIDTSAETTVLPNYHKDSNMGHSPAAGGTPTEPVTPNRESDLHETTIIHNESGERPVDFEFDFPILDAWDENILLYFDDQRADSLIDNIEAKV